MSDDNCDRVGENYSSFNGKGLNKDQPYHPAPFFFYTYIPYFYSATSQNKSKLNLHVDCVVQVTPHHLHQQLN